MVSCSFINWLFFSIRIPFADFGLAQFMRLNGRFSSKPLIQLFSKNVESGVRGSRRIIGINYGTKGSNLPSPYQSIRTLTSMQAHYVKLYDANHETLKLLSNTNIRVSIMLPDKLIPQIASNHTIARQWFDDNVLAYYPLTKIRFIMVGNEVLGTRNPDQWNNLVPAMKIIWHSLKTHHVHNIKIGTPMAMDILGSTFPPSNGSFRTDILATMSQLLDFLNGTRSFFFLNVYPYFPWSENQNNISLDFTLFRGEHLTYRDPGSGLLYTNLLDQMLDSVNSAMSKLGFPTVRIAISETGWPNNGNVAETGANIYNAATYNRNLIRKITSTPPLGTPARPGAVIPTFLFSLYDEDLKDGPETERHWGLFRPDGTPVYEIDLTGSRTSYGRQFPSVTV
ncbi:hypothetical protein Nepgr_022106 [Nepenthes gracilis]|uniref:glucan endo-1,3-beta-D-glucosidase n=1 Tax=Nepenthes gracilis TaxID=150966 RepID=A0AAD3XXV2_NEPGR|nr:hypothetical protein Nepgr_022106 [Nepenthes gracilis]